MIADPNWFKGKRITVMGLGLHGGGLGVAKWLLRRGARLTVTDLRSESELKRPMAELEREYQRCRKRSGGPRAYRIAYVLERHLRSDFTGADLVIRNPAVPRENQFLAVAIKKGIPVESDISLFFHLCPFPITAVTGTKGKSTTTALLAAICQRHNERTMVGGNIRISPMAALDGLIRLAKRSGVKPPPVVLELSSWQLESLEKHCLSPHVAVITNVMRDHLNRYGGKMSSYAAAKELLVRFQGPNDVAILNGTDRWIAAMAKRLTAKWPLAPRIVPFANRSSAAKDGCFVRAGQIFLATKNKLRPVMAVEDIPLPGEHNLPNVLAAVAAADALDVPVRTIAAAVRRFAGVSGRLETVAIKGGVTYINDTTATTPEASIAAINAYTQGRSKRVVLLAGGADKDLRFGDWAKVVRQKAKELILFDDGAATKKMLSALKRCGAKPPWLADSMPKAVKLASSLAEKGDCVILSPGCASFGMFQNEFDRGDQFADAVQRLK